MENTKFTNKDIQFNIMMALMKIEGHLAEMLSKKDEPEMLTGGEVDELTKSDK